MDDLVGAGKMGGNSEEMQEMRKKMKQPPKESAWDAFWRKMGM
jgi:hypothetical protein